MPSFTVPTLGMEIADTLDKRHLPYGLIDLDFLAWFEGDTADQGAETLMWLANTEAVVANHLAVGVRFLIVAWSIADRSQLDELGAVVAMPLRVVRLAVPIDEIARRLNKDVTAGRTDDRRVAADWLRDGDGIGTGIEDETVANDRSIRAVAGAILARLARDLRPDLRSRSGTGLGRHRVLGVRDTRCGWVPRS
jgi:hypothetical protein